MLHHWHAGVDKGESVRTVFVDFAKALCGKWPPFCKSDDSAWRSATSCQAGCSCQLACHWDHTSVHWRLLSSSTCCNQAVWHINTWTTQRWRWAGRQSATCSYSSTSAWWWTAVRRKSCWLALLYACHRPPTWHLVPVLRFRSSITVSPFSVANVRKNYVHP